MHSVGAEYLSSWAAMAIWRRYKELEKVTYSKPQQENIEILPFEAIRRCAVDKTSLRARRSESCSGSPQSRAWPTLRVQAPSPREMRVYSDRSKRAFFLTSWPASQVILASSPGPFLVLQLWLTCLWADTVGEDSSGASPYNLLLSMHNITSQSSEARP